MDGSDFISAASTRPCDAEEGPSAARAAAMDFSLCSASENASTSSHSTRSDCGFGDVGGCNEDLVCPLCELCDDDLHDDPDGESVGLRELVVCEGCQGGFHVACVRALPPLRRPPQPADHRAAIDWSTTHMQRGSGTWRCKACVKEGRWGVCLLIESAVTFGGDARCAQGSATYSVLMRFHAGGAAPRGFCMVVLHPAATVRVRFRTPPCTKSFMIVSDASLCCDQDPHGKLKRLLECPPLTGPA